MSYIVIAGQSNALGFGNTDAAPYAPTSRVQIWTDTNGDGVADAWNYMQPGVNTGTLNNPKAWGPEVGVAKSWLAQNPTGVLWIVKEAHGSTGLAQDLSQLDWSPHSTGEMFDRATTDLHAAKADLAGTPYAFKSWDAVLWMQGETDATDPMKAAHYADNLAQFIADARQAWDAGAFVIGRIANNDAELPYNLDVREAEWNVDQADDRTSSFRTIGFETQDDDLHLDGVGQIQLGQAFYDTWIA